MAMLAYRSTLDLFYCEVGQQAISYQPRVNVLSLHNRDHRYCSKKMRIKLVIKAIILHLELSEILKHTISIHEFQDQLVNMIISTESHTQYTQR